MTPRDKKVMKTVEDYRDMLASYMYLLKTPNRAQFGKVMGVDAWAFPKFDTSPNIAFYTEEGKWKQGYYFDRKANKFTPDGVRRLTWMQENSDVWNRYYEFLGPINILIKDIESAEGTDENLRNYVKGEALVWRAFSYYKLLQYYAPYKENKYGIPMYLDPSEDIGNAMPKRLPQTEVFANILKDCNTVLTLLEKTPTTEWSLAYRTDFVHAMMASIYTWKAMSGAAEDSDWKMADEHATKGIQNRKLTQSVDELKRMFDCSPEFLKLPFDSPEFFFRIMSGSEGYVCTFADSYLGAPNGMSAGEAAPQYIALYTDTDKRKGFYFDESGKQNRKYS
ncbi:MAG: RagB/SusD family nutrient uptake outer membrane protein [Bacteroidia bacterium]|nr:RagB/SusD family nutrient uptake outer membrane protein [Bacteroidia bacterium]